MQQMFYYYMQQRSRKDDGWVRLLPKQEGEPQRVSPSRQTILYMFQGYRGITGIIIGKYFLKMLVIRSFTPINFDDYKQNLIN